MDLPVLFFAKNTQKGALPKVTSILRQKAGANLVILNLSTVWESFFMGTSVPFIFGNERIAKLRERKTFFIVALFLNFFEKNYKPRGVD